MPPMAQPKRRESKSPSSRVPAPGPTLAPAEPDSVSPAADAWQKPEGLSRTGWAVLAGVIVLVNLPLLHYLVRSEAEATVALPYQNSFQDPSAIKRDFFTTGGFWRVQGGELLSPGVRNNPLWLKARLPENVRIDFDVRSTSPEGDIRAIVFGDGLNYQLSGYHLIQGGWTNSLSVLARLEDNAPNLNRFQAWAADIGRRRGQSTVNWVEAGLFNADTKVRVETNGRAVPGQRYHWTIERRGSVIRWS